MSAKRMSTSAEATIFAVAVTFIMLAVLGALWTISGCAHSDDAGARDAAAGPIEHAPGMPLDAISYDPPAWLPECYEAYRIYDRTNGQQWWLLAIDTYGAGTDLVALPIGDGNDAT